MRYVQDIEYGEKRIANPDTLRNLSALLNIPLWHFGLSEYDPFYPDALSQGRQLHEETLNTVECLIHQAWMSRSAALMHCAEKCSVQLNSLFLSFQRDLPPPFQFEQRYLKLLAQAIRLNAVTLVEQKKYEAARMAYQEMFQMAQQTNDPGVLALAMMSYGSELERDGRAREAVEWLEGARDNSFQASKHIAAFVHTYLARVYASRGDTLHFERAADTAYSLATGVSNYGEGTDFVFARLSSILAEQSWGYLQLKQPQKTLEMRDGISKQIERDGDRRLWAWIFLDWAKAYHMQREIEASVGMAREFLHQVHSMRSPHAVTQAHSFIAQVRSDGYADVPVVRDFLEELTLLRM
ncbi:hypothetical protein Krac_3932 [Ktedonobacter racemifer DSM 44963]|uniref:HTH cro/C1-type domain-containing protein n=2 Tax=Ktedonobacter racemifer TaxID=363277 RepID=D6U3N1_KTERA|nr:hypothetical protein Krac_3932 [Ktedonobacter racemifer DSM 44963]